MQKEQDKKRLATLTLAALGIGLLFGVLRLINFAHGDVFMVGSVAAFLVVLGIGLTGGSGLLIILVAALSACAPRI